MTITEKTSNDTIEKSTIGPSEAIPQHHTDAPYSSLQDGRISPQSYGGAGEDCSCGAEPDDSRPISDSSASPFVNIFSIGELQLSFSSLDIKKEFDQAAQLLKVNTDEYGKIFNHIAYLDQQKKMPYKPYLYLAKKVSWIWTIANVDSYIIFPDSPLCLDQLINCIDAQKNDNKTVLAGERGNNNFLAPYGNTKLAAVIPNHLFSVGKVALEQLHLAANDGSTDVDRALNFFSLEFNTLVSENPELAPNNTNNMVPHLASINPRIIEREDTGNTHAGDSRVVVELILEYQDESKSIERFYTTAIDVTDNFPFIQSTLRDYSPST